MTKKMVKQKDSKNESANANTGGVESVRGKGWYAFKNAPGHLPYLQSHYPSLFELQKRENHKL